MNVLDPEKIARLESWKDGHEERCTERYERITSDTSEIKTALISLATKFETAITRVHDRIDSQVNNTSDAKVWGLKSVIYLALVILGYALSHWGPLK